MSTRSICGERAAIFSFLINSYFSRCLCRTRAAAAVSVPVEEERLLLFENPEDLPSNEMLSRSSELSCQKKATQWRKARQPAQSGRQIETQTPHTLITFWGTTRADNSGKPPRAHKQKSVASSRPGTLFTINCDPNC